MPSDIDTLGPMTKFTAVPSHLGIGQIQQVGYGGLSFKPEADKEARLAALEARVAALEARAAFAIVSMPETRAGPSSPDDTPIEAFNLTCRSENVLCCGCGLKTAGEVRRMSDQKLMREPNFGRVSLREVRERIGPGPKR